MRGVEQEGLSLRLGALLAGSSIGLLLAAAVLGWIFALGDPRTGTLTATRYVLGGYLALLPTVLLLGSVVLRIARHRGLSFSQSLVLGAAVALASAILAGIVVGIVTGQFWNSLLSILLITSWCLVPALGLARPLSSRPRWVRVINTVTPTIALCGLLVSILS